MAWWWTFGEVPEIPARDVHQFLTEISNGEAVSNPGLSKFTSVTVVDVRTEGEYAAGHIAFDAIHSCSMVPPWSLRSRLESLSLSKEPNYLILCICLSAHRSIAAVKLLKEMGYDENAMQLQGGMQAWRAAELPEKCENEEEEENNV